MRICYLKLKRWLLFKLIYALSAVLRFLKSKVPGYEHVEFGYRHRRRSFRGYRRRIRVAKR